MKRILFLSFLSFVLFGFLGCKKTELKGEYQAYIGTWKGPGIKLELNYNGSARYVEDMSVGTRSIDNARLIIEDGKLTIREFLIKKEFNIDIPPHGVEVSGSETIEMMRLDGMDFQKSS